MVTRWALFCHDRERGHSGIAGLTDVERMMIESLDSFGTPRFPSGEGFNLQPAT